VKQAWDKIGELYGRPCAAQPAIIDDQMTDTISLLEERASKLGCQITLRNGPLEEGIDHGPYMLCCAVTGARIWPTGLTIEGIAEALNCFERELQLPDDQKPGAWADFGSRW
jgi:hypothetical protein